MGRKALHIDAAYISARTSAGPNGCLLWSGKLSHGYGNIRSRQAHRVVYEMAKGPVAEGFVVHHVCRNRACVNVDHLSVLPKRVHMTLHHNPYADELRKKLYSRSNAVAVSA